MQQITFGAKWIVYCWSYPNIRCYVRSYAWQVFDTSSWICQKLFIQPLRTLALLYNCTLVILFHYVYFLALLFVLMYFIQPHADKKLSCTLQLFRCWSSRFTILGSSPWHLMLLTFSTSVSGVEVVSFWQRMLKFLLQYPGKQFCAVILLFVYCKNSIKRFKIFFITCG